MQTPPRAPRPANPPPPPAPVRPRPGPRMIAPPAVGPALFPDPSPPGGGPPEGGRRGTIRRKAYTRKGYTRKSGVHVKGARVSARMIPDVGAPGKWRYEHMGAPGIGKLKEGELTSVGYSTTAKASSRHRALTKAMKRYGPLSTYRKLNAVAVYTKRTSPSKSKMFREDRNWVGKHSGYKST